MTHRLEEAQIMFHNDADIQRDLIAEMRWEPSLRDDDIGVAVRDGVVTLAGFVDSYADKWEAERVASQVKGVKAIANDLEVKIPSISQRTDPEVARTALDALKWNISVPPDRIKVKVEKGWITLEGTADWYFQKEAAERAVRYLTGVKGVSNLVMVKPVPAPSDVKQLIKDSLQRGAQFDADRISVEISGNKSILKGTVRSYAEYRDAERAARNAAGITEVENKLTVDPTVYAPV
ncbi:MAG: BON domain-containing protein [Gemmatimonadaceae bacterium]